MSTLPVVKDGAEGAANFPVGGRPQEYRALEEASAFEKWFEQTATPHSDERAAADADGARSEASAGRTAARRAGSEAASRQVTAGRQPAAAARATEDSSRGAANAAAGRTPAPPAAGGLGTSVLARAAEMARSAALSEAAPAGARLHQYSKTALTAVLDDKQVRVWMRDYRLSPRELEQLQQGLTEQLRSLGYRLAKLVVNGETRY